MKFNKAPSWQLIKGPERNTLDIKPKYDYYTRIGDADKKEVQSCYT